MSKPTVIDANGFSYIGFWDKNLEKIIFQIDNNFFEALCKACAPRATLNNAEEQEFRSKYGSKITELINVMRDGNQNFPAYLMEKALDTYYVSPGDSLNGSWTDLAYYPDGWKTSVSLGKSKAKVTKGLEKNKPDPAQVAIAKQYIKGYCVKA